MNTATSLDRIYRNRFVQNLHTFFTNWQALAVGLVFASDSLLFGSWVAHIPHVKEKLHLSDADLGLTLFAMPIGLIIMNPLTGWIIARLGEARACFWSAVGVTLAVCIPINAPSQLVMALGLFLLGLTSALLNVAMNTAATNVEKAWTISIMSSCHGMWSLGGLIGSGLAGLVIAMHVSPSVHMAVMAALGLLLTFLLQPALQTIPSSNRATVDGPTPPSETVGEAPTAEGAFTASADRPGASTPGESTPGASFVIPNLDLTLMILIGLAVAMGEGAALDWSAVYLRESLGASSQVAALGFGAFSLTMTSFRFLGDGIIPKIGAKRWLQLGGLLGATGLLLAILLPYPTTALFGFALLGIGCSLGAPILYSASMRVPGISPAAGLATFATFSFVGFLAGPPVIGFVAESFGLYYGLGLVAAILLLSAGLSRVVKLF